MAEEETPASVMLGDNSQMDGEALQQCNSIGLKDINNIADPQEKSVFVSIAFAQERGHSP